MLSDGDQLQIQQLVHHQHLGKNVVMLSDGDQLQQQQVHHQYLQIKTFTLSHEKQLQQQQQVSHHLQRNLKRILTMLDMLSDQRTSHSNFMILQHQYLVNRIKDCKKVMEMNQSVKYLVASSQGHLKMNEVMLSELRKRRRKKEKMNLVSFQKHLMLSERQNHMYSI